MRRVFLLTALSVASALRFARQAELKPIIELPSESACLPRICFNPDYVWNSELCTCIKNVPCNIRCATGYHLAYTVEGKCYCAPSSPPSPSKSCNIRCPEGYVVDEIRCRCVPPLSEASVEPDTSESSPESSSHYDTWPSSSNSEEPSSVSSPYCDPATVECSQGYIFDEIICECIPNHMIPSCPPGQIYDLKACACVCSSDCSDCPNNFIWDNQTCGCVCPKSITCEPGFEFEEETCSCVCGHESECASGFYFNHDKCVCACAQSEICEDGNVWDDLSCQCVPDHTPSCAAGFMYDQESCMCICEQKFECEAPKVFDEIVCGCVCRKTEDCLGIWNETSCTCDYVVKK